MENKITQEKLKELFIYNKKTGLFTRRVSTGRHDCHKAGEIAGTKLTHRYVVISIGTQRYMAHRLAWLYVYGIWPAGDLDHINQDKYDNRITNLREATRKQNMQNVTRHKHNTSGFKGVAWHKQRNRWRAYIFIDYKQKHLGLFETKEKANEARLDAEKIYHSHSTQTK